MKPILLPIPLALMACSALALGGCGALENFGGTKKVSPDEFKIVSHSPPPRITGTWLSGHSRSCIGSLE